MENNSDDDFDAGVVIEDQLWVGSLHATRDLANLQKYGITGILTAAHGLQIPKHSGIRYLKVVMSDHPGEDLLSKLPQAMEFLDDELINNNGKVLVHCAAGVSRSVSVCIAYLMCRKNYPFKTALDIVRLKRSFINPNVGFMVQLTELEAANGDIERAKQLYTQRIQGASLEDSLTVWRNESNAIHHKLDELEIKIHSGSEYIDSKDEEMVLLKLLSEADAAMEIYVADKVSAMILSSATAKGKRLLILVQGKSLEAGTINF